MATWAEMPRSPGHAFYDRLQEVLREADFDAFVDLVRRDDRFVVKVTCPERISKLGPPYDDFVPYGRRVVEAIPDRVLWGTDWPHPNMRTHMPDDGKLVDMIPKIAVTAEEQRKLLVDNPMRLYWG